MSIARHRGPNDRCGRRDERGSVLMLMPAAVLIVLLLGAITVDAAVVYLAQREAYNVAFDAANDAAGAGLDVDLLRRTGEIAYDPARVAAIARRSVHAAGGDLHLVAATIDGDAVVVTVEATVDHVFAPAFRDDAGERLRVEAQVEGQLRRPPAS